MPRIERLTGPVARCEPVEGGYTHARRLRVFLADGRSVFVKAAVDELSAGWIEAELSVYEALRAPFVPDFLGADRDGLPLFAIEDLGGVHWPPPWEPEHVAAVRRSLDELAATAPPPGLPTVQGRADLASGWPAVRDDPEPFLSAGLCSPDWLGACLPTLLEASVAADTSGDALVHFDVRSDNIAIRGDRALLVDWNWVCVGNHAVDLVTWCPSLHLEGGPPPEEIVSGPGVPELAAALAGFWAARAGLPPPPTGPRVREIQLAQLGVVLPWACRLLGVEAPR